MEAVIERPHGETAPGKAGRQHGQEQADKESAGRPQGGATQKRSIRGRFASAALHASRSGPQRSAAGKLASNAAARTRRGRALLAHAGARELLDGLRLAFPKSDRLSTHYLDCIERRLAEMEAE